MMDTTSRKDGMGMEAGNGVVAVRVAGALMQLLLVVRRCIAKEVPQPQPWTTLKLLDVLVNFKESDKFSS